MEREVAALIALAAKRGEEAVGILRAAAQSEAELPPPLGLPEPIKPAPELLGEVLLELGRPAEAVELFAQALGRNANRSLSVLGLARAAAAGGDASGAREHYRQLLVNFSAADPDLAVLSEARTALDQTGAPGVELTQPRTPGEPLEPRRPVWWLGLFTSPGGLLIVALAVGAVVVTWLVARQSMRPTPARTKKKGPR
jgi:tetratricopeptide (TPR) repeat protein